MTDQEIRTMLVTALAEAGVGGIRMDSLDRRFVAGETDIAFDKLDMDSLANMELCIAIEVNTGISIVPDELARAGSLGAIGRMIASRTAPATAPAA